MMMLKCYEKQSGNCYLIKEKRWGNVAEFYSKKGDDLVYAGRY